MTGYQETLTDPSYYGQIVTQTFPTVGNYGANDQDFESKRCFLSGYIVREWCEIPSNFRMQYDPGRVFKSPRRDRPIWDRHPAADSDYPGARGDERHDYHRSNPPTNRPLWNRLTATGSKGRSKACRHKNAPFTPPCQTRFHVALLDFGAKRNIGRELVKRGLQM